jgi:cyanate permease
METISKQDKKNAALLPKVLKKFEKQKQRKKGLYVKAFDIMNAITSVLAETVKDFSVTAYFASLSSIYNSSSQV